MLTGFTLAAAAFSVSAHAFSGLAMPLNAAESLELSNDKTLTKSFNNATAKEVFDWMKSQKLNFVVDVTQIPDKRVTLSFDKVPADTAIRAISRALGFGWAREGEVFVLSQSPVMNRFMPEGLDWARAGSQMPDFMKEWEVPFFGKPGDKDFLSDVMVLPYFGDGQDLTPEQKKKWEEWSKKFGESFGREWSERFTPEMLEKLKGEGRVFRFGPEFFDGKDGERFKIVVPEGFEMSDEHKKALEQARVEIRKLQDGTLKQLKELNLGEGGVFRMNGMNINKLKESLSAGQKEIMKNKGYLELGDLTEEQKKYLGDLPKGAQVKLKLDGSTTSISITTTKSEGEGSKIKATTSAYL